MDVELAQQPDGWAGDVLAQAPVQGRALGGQVDLGAALDQPVGFEPGEQLAGGAGVQVDLTPEGTALHQSLREYIAGPTVRLLSQFDIRDIETTVRTMQEITKLAEAESSASVGGQPE